MGRTMILPYDVTYTHHCPFCRSLDTEYHPATRTGRCHAPGCGRTWRMTRPEPGHRRRTPRDLDLVDDALMFLRRGVPRDRAFAAYAKMEVPGVTRERFEQAWARARDLSS